MSALLSNAQTPAPEGAYPNVLVELFSSEGCSSCPVADDFLKDIIRIADSTQSPVFCLDYHVDIWNRSGWVDRFSDTSFSRRQREYMVKSGQPALFTPMVFVNGGGAYPGAAKKEIGKAINRNLMTNPITKLEMKVSFIPTSSSLLIRYNAVGRIDSCTFNAVLAFKEVKSDITAGENAGKTLVHHHTVQSWKWQQITPSGKGEFQMQLPPGASLDNLILVGFVQHDPTWTVLTTEQLEFKK